MIAVVDTNYLTWEVIITGDPDEPDYEYFHPCIKWCHEYDIPYEQIIEVMPQEECIKDWDSLDRPVDIRMSFETEAEAVMFKLRWSEEE